MARSVKARFFTEFSGSSKSATEVNSRPSLETAGLGSGEFVDRRVTTSCRRVLGVLPRRFTAFVLIPEPWTAGLFPDRSPGWFAGLDPRIRARHGAEDTATQRCDPRADSRARRGIGTGQCSAPGRRCSGISTNALNLGRRTRRNPATGRRTCGAAEGPVSNGRTLVKLGPGGC